MTNGNVLCSRTTVLPIVEDNKMSQDPLVYYVTLDRTMSNKRVTAMPHFTVPRDIEDIRDKYSSYFTI